jgi:hypothetical protein
VVASAAASAWECCGNGVDGGAREDLAGGGDGARGDGSAEREAGGEGGGDGAGEAGGGAGQAVSLEGQCDQFTEEWTLVRVAITGENDPGRVGALDLHLPLQGRKSEPGEEAVMETDAGWRLHLLGQGK